MTNEEAIANINMIRVAFVDPVTKEQRKLIDDTLDTAIKALEREPILDKIRAEIESLERFEMRGEKTPLVNGDKALAIIDRYTAEMESEE